MGFSFRFFLLRLRHASAWELIYRVYQALVAIYLKIYNKTKFRIVSVTRLSHNQVQHCKLPGFVVTDIRIPKGQDIETFCSSMSMSAKLRPAGCRSGSDREPTEPDIRLTWEPARLQHGVLLLCRALQFPNAPIGGKSKAMAKDTIFRWIAANPFGQGILYSSAMECALRIPVFFYALKVLDNLIEYERDLLLKAIYCNAWLISKRVSLYSSLGNHTIAESVGLIFAGAIFNILPEGRHWLSKGLALLDQELTHQILDDGGPAEQSLSYHRFVLDLYWLAVDFLEKNGLYDACKWKGRLRRGESFFSAFQDKDGAYPSIGDSDDGHAIAPGIAPRRGVGQTFPDGFISFQDAGYTVTRRGSLVFTFDHGALGMKPFHGHGHADALAVTLSKNGRSILVDPGTYKYNGSPKWRRYFKGTRSHNTVTVDNRDQAIQETSFIWRKPFTCRLIGRYDDGIHQYCSAEHDGYTRLNRPVWHRRSILYFEGANFMVQDGFRGRGEHRFQLNFHLHPEATATKKGKWWVVNVHGESIYLCLQGGEFELICGKEDPPHGWYSATYGERITSPVLTCEQIGDVASAGFTTAIFNDPPPNFA